MSTTCFFVCSKFCERIGSGKNSPDHRADLNFCNRKISRWSTGGDGIGVGIEILMQREGFVRKAGEGVHAHKPANHSIHVSCSQIVEAGIRIKELACKKMIIGGGSGFVKQISKGVVIVGIADSFTIIGQCPCAAEAVGREWTTRHRADTRAISQGRW